MSLEIGRTKRDHKKALSKKISASTICGGVPDEVSNVIALAKT